MLFLAEFYLAAGASLAEVATRARTGARRASMDGASVRFIQVVFTPGDECCFALYEAASEAEVTAAGTLAGLEFDRLGHAVAEL
jgi:hypothetical protein